MATRRKLREEQIISVMKQLEADRTAAEMASEVGWAMMFAHAIRHALACMPGAKPFSPLPKFGFAPDSGAVRPLPPYFSPGRGLSNFRDRLSVICFADAATTTMAFASAFRNSARNSFCANFSFHRDDGRGFHQTS